MITIDKKLGIIGGMGSFASSSLYDSIIKKSPAQSDGEHIEIIIHNNPKIPDRTQGILYGGMDAKNEILRSAKMMDELRIDYLLMACVTAHHYHEKVQNEMEFSEVIDIREVIKDYISRHLAGVRTVGLLATTGVVKVGLWTEKLQEIGVEIICLPDDLQEELFMEAVYGEKGLKAGYFMGKPKELLQQACSELTRLGADAILSSCSEMPLILSQKDIEEQFIDVFEIVTDYTLKKFYK